MNIIYFKDNDERLKRLVDMKVLSKTSKESKIDGLKYKQILNGKTVEFDCNVLGFAYKETKPKCHDNIYENLIIEACGRKFHINIEHFASMQKKSFGSETEPVE